MVKQREFEGKDLEEALAAAAAAMGIAEPELDYEILEPGRRGLFGVGAKSVRIAVMPPLGDPPGPLAANELLGTPERRPPRRSEARAERPPRQERQERQERPERRGRSGRRQRAQRGSRPGEGRSRPEPTQAEEARREPPRPAAEPSPLAPEVAACLQRILDLSALELEATPVGSETGVAIQLDGEDRKLLVQKDAELLGALQFLLNRMARRSWPDAGRIHLTCDGHRQKRDDELVELTREVAQQVEQTGRTKRLHPMNAYERRLVHLTVREFDKLGSRSEGDGHLKRVKIYLQSGAEA